MKNYLLFTLFIFVCIACQEPVAENFEYDGVSLTCPKGWKITDKDSLDGNGYYLTLEKNGFSSSGLVVISMINGALDLETWMSLNQDEMKRSQIFESSNLHFEENKNDKYNGINTISSKFSVTVIGVDHEGTMHVFNENGKTFALIEQEAVEDKMTNMKGFELIEQSFKLG